MKIGIDFGITHTDVAISNDQGTNFQTFKSLDINQDLKSVFDLLKDPHNIKKIFVTGGKSSDLPKHLMACLWVIRMKLIQLHLGLNNFMT